MPDSPFHPENIKELVRELKEQQKSPHVIDQALAKKNTVGITSRHPTDIPIPGQSADHPDKLPRLSPEEEWRKSEDIKRLIETKSRPGQLNFRENPAARILDHRGQYVKPKTQYDDNALPTPEQQQRVATKKVKVAIYALCMKCMQGPIAADDIWPNLMFVPDYQAVLNKPPADADAKFLEAIREERDKWAGIRLKPGDGLGWVYHVSCVMNEIDFLKRLAMRWGRAAAAKEAHGRAKAMQENVFSYLRNERLKPDSDVFHEDEAS